MHPLVNHVIQLQELILIRDEQKVAGSRARLGELDQSIEDMTAALPADVRALFTKLHHRDHVVAVPVCDGSCVVCGMKLPISLVQAMRLGRQIHTCPNCARILYETVRAPRRIGRAPRRTEPRKVGIARFSAPALMIPRLVSATCEEAIRELAGKMEEQEFVNDGDKLADAAIRREAVVSTAVDHGLAFPHARGVEGGGLSLALGLSPKGIRFEAAARSRTRIVFFLAIPTAASAFYLKLLAGLTETFRDADARKTLLAAKEPGDLWKTLVKLTRSTIK